jgi:hypothetical protein
MPRRFSQDHREPDQVDWSELPRLFWMFFGIAMLMGFVIGLGWIAWNLIRLHVLN